ncbi:hypothetical protein DYD21_08215 [Rhodohalobacter sp. SW132]|uniref:ATP-binding protein n=1 Tax=Rhodohalobacter sp. SW132 TaxID=2293433 RepID=UPI000E242B44|nr:hypothetical protein [Rhodohalobacter sp. SW132]REL37756.1 hypothetical protein DYD21_08215 [Rhodohalobacter sp. SW132]
MNNSSKKPLRIKDLTIGTMPGFPSGMKPFEDFSDGINIIAGPNASGKSTTANAIQKLIWQNDTSRIKLSGHAEMNGDPWTLRVDSGHKLVQRNGVDDEITGVPAAEEQNRYMLALHKLLTADGKELAKQIIRESVGGYDPEKAAENLEYSSNISPKNTRVFKSFDDAEKAVRKSQQAQKEIKEEEEKLTDLYLKREKAEQSLRRAEFYELTVEKMKAEQSFEELRDQKERLPSVLENAHGEELSRVEGIESEISDAEEKIRSANRVISDCRDRLGKLTIPESGVSEKDLDELENRVKRIGELEKEIASLEKDQKSLEKKRSEALKRIGEDADPEKLRKLDLQDVGDLDRFLEEAHRVASDKRVLEQENSEFEKEKSGELDDPEAIRDGIGALGNWLKEVPTGRSFPSWVILSIVVLAVLSAVAGFFIPEVGLVGLIAILLFSVYGWMQLRNKGDNQTERVRVGDFQNTGLNPPAAWNPEEVRTRLDELISELRDARWQERIAGKLENSRSRLNELQSRMETVEKRGGELKERLSVIPELPFEEPAGYSQLAWYVTAVQNWQTADADLKALVEAGTEKRDQYGEEIEKATTLIKPYSDPSIEDSAEADAVFKNLKKQEEKRSRAVEEIGRQKTAIETEQELIDRKKQDLKAIYNKFEIPAGEKDQLRKLVDQVGEYDEIVNDYQVAEREYQKKLRSLVEHSLYEEEQDRLAKVTADQAEAYRKELLEEGDKVENLREEIARIEARVENVKSGNSLERALAERDEAVEGLKNLYEQNLSKLTGRLLVDKVKERMREQNRPKVFKEANRLFNRITKGRYELRIEENDESVFRAYDTVDKEGRSLDELSSGTRIQLLMAVRLAFVETQETSIKLPILADELLANSDDIRAEAIIEALTEISRDGRQVFYFTAQGDEVAKWENYLNQNGMNDHKVFYLTGERSGATYKTTQPDWQPISLLQDIPGPGSLSYNAYGEKLNVPPFNPLTDEPEQLHLWYLMDDPDLLYNTLSSGINYWGALKNYLKEGGIIEGLDEQEIRKMEEKAELLDRYLKLYRQGRPRPIDRGVLEESGAVSDSFIDAVSEKLEELNSDPAKLLEALRNGEISGFRTNKMDELENYLLEQGYLDTREPLQREMIENALNALISNLSISRKEADIFLRRFIG